MNTVSPLTTTAAAAAAILNGTTAVAALATFTTTGNTPGDVQPLAAADFTGGITRDLTLSANWETAWTLPADCCRLLTVDGDDPDIPQNRFELQGRHLLLDFTPDTAPVCRYITTAPAVTQWPATFTDAVVYLLAAKLAPKITGSMDAAANMRGMHEMALAKARSKDARETHSNENHGPRQLAARSGLVRARYGHFPPPY